MSKNTEQESIQKSDVEWQAELPPEVYEITRKKGTERPFTGEYYHFKEPGQFVCRCCKNPLFDSTTKYDSGSGWPSFWQPIKPENVETESDFSHGMKRVEILCSRCRAHLGHVFEDGPQPTGLRYCVNSASLQFQKPEETPPKET